MALGTFDRADALARLDGGEVDVLVVGGGITGAGVALDAASRGFRTALVDRGDLASGTSSKSSKLVHGGLRYLQQGDVRLVYEALHERQRLLRNAPHLVEVLPFLIPAFTGRDGVVPKGLWKALGSAMWMYDLTGGARIGKLHRRLSAADVLAHMPTLPERRLAGGYLYYDATADDARLTLTLARTAAIDHGALVANHTALTSFTRGADGRATGARLRTVEGHELEVRAGVVVNAAGVWSDDVRALDEGVHPDGIRPAKGVHITVPWALVRNDVAVVVPVPGDKRSVFVVPWGGRPGEQPRFTFIGTTDTDHDGPLDDPRCTPEDVEYLLRAINFSVDASGPGGRAITPADIVGTWAGLRPLVKAASTGRTADLSRGHRVSTSGTGVVTVTGGKLTTYRHMAADAVDEAAELLSEDTRARSSRRSRTARMPLRGADGHDALVADPDPMVRHLASRYGGEARVLLAMIERDPSLGEALVDGLDHVRAEAVFAARHEMARSVDDVLSRRTRALLQARDASAAAAPDVADLVGDVLGWDSGERRRQVEAYLAVVDAERDAEATPA